MFPRSHQQTSIPSSPFIVLTYSHTDLFTFFISSLSFYFSFLFPFLSFLLTNFCALSLFLSIRTCKKWCFCSPTFSFHANSGSNGDSLLFSTKKVKCVLYVH